MDYGYYITVFGGTVIPEADFDRLCREAEVGLKALLYPTDPQCSSGEKKESYRRALCCQAEHLYTVGERDHGVKAERLGEYSVEYRSPGDGGSHSVGGCALSPAAVNLLMGSGLLVRWV